MKTGLTLHQVAQHSLLQCQLLESAAASTEALAALLDLRVQSVVAAMSSGGKGAERHARELEANLKSDVTGATTEPVDKRATLKSWVRQLRNCSHG